MQYRGGEDEKLIGALANRVHRALARGPRSLSSAYITCISWISRSLLPLPAQRRVRNAICSYGHQWPDFDFAPRRVRVGTRTGIALIPHWGEFDQEALFLSTLEYEVPVMRWLEDNVGATYDLVIEIGANAGLYTVFFDALMKDAPALPDGRERKVVSFEPSGEAYRRLLANLAVNGTRHVVAFQAAVGERSGLQSFFEPRQHLTNGSLLREFSENFTDRIDEATAVVVAAPELARWLSPAGRALIKIDVEGFEPALLGALAPLLERHHPDLLIEVLPFTLDALNAMPTLAGYDKYMLLPEGPVKADRFEASARHRDWLLRRPGH